MPGNVTIFRTTNPVDFGLVDGVFIDERRPPGRIRGIGNDVACVVGEFERGPVDRIVEIGDTNELFRIFGGYGPDANGNPYKGYLSLVGKQFARLRVIRVSNSTQATATVTLNDGAGSPVNVLRADANSPGRWGNSLTVQVVVPAASGVSTEFDLKVFRNGVQQEIHRGLDLADVAVGEAFPITSDFIVLTKLAAGDGLPVNNASPVALASGGDGTFADADYTGSSVNGRGIRQLYTSEATNIRWVWVAENTAAAVLAALRTLAEDTKTKIAVIAGASGNTKAQALSDVASYRSDRVVYVYPWVKVFVPEANGGAGGLVTVSPASFAVAACAALAPGTDPAGVNSEPFLTGIREINDRTLSWNDYVSFNEGGIMALQFAAERQRHGFRSGVSTSLDTSLNAIARRTMADFLQESIAARLVFFQNKPLKRSTKYEIKSEIEDFLDGWIRDEILPSRADLEFSDGTRLYPYEVDIFSGNTAESEAAGRFVVFLRVRIFASMRHIVLRTEIGQGVEIQRPQEV